MIEIEDRVRELITEATNFPIWEVTDESTLTGDLDLDSMDLANLAVEFEAEFNIEVPDGFILSNMTVRQLMDGIKRLRQDSSSGE